MKIADSSFKGGQLVLLPFMWCHGPTSTPDDSQAYVSESGRAHFGARFISICAKKIKNLREDSYSNAWEMTVRQGLHVLLVGRVMLFHRFSEASAFEDIVYQVHVVRRSRACFKNQSDGCVCLHHPHPRPRV